MPLLTRMLNAPLSIDVRRGAVAALGELLADRRIATEGRVAIAVGPGQGDQIADHVRPSLAACEVYRVAGGTVDAAVELAGRLRAGRYEAVVGIGGGRTIDATKYAATLSGIPMVSVATNLSHDGICSPVASLTHDNGKGSFGVVMPLAMIVDLDYVRAAPERLVRAGVGDVLSNFSAVEDWLLAAEQCGERVDRMALTVARTAAEALLHQPESIESDRFLTVLAESLVLSGMSMAFAGDSRPASGGDHEILHAIDHLYPDTANHGELAGLGTAFCYHLRATRLGDGAERLAEILTCLGRHGLPRLPGDVGLSVEQFAEAVLYAPRTRPGRYTILEYLDLDKDETLKAVEQYVQAHGG
ncbi:iron-containing alcohol dehydrogenase family protein [Actinomadura livida]|uniref:Glycerol-1-phosphate dehydrogenase [NAD(P)+] n=1 Tax=Actinomadura livida TaxID=79909 RepID=A0A7W7IIZ0_9ACTN|nr:MULTISPECIES: iron-containing alcohol dehydrogenase family protein [Actinomadura]MBB4777987.1 glycerol-1-phosphate dehydrogenase [NAD(P)+] [Actinomadura catellatispora]GGT97416.1 glycerol dehydrogenase [Actinomadura livida]